jgi:hypothetical protein
MALLFCVCLQAAADVTQTLTDAGVAIDTDHFYTAGYGESCICPQARPGGGGGGGCASTRCDGGGRGGRGRGQALGATTAAWCACVRACVLLTMLSAVRTARQRGFAPMLIMTENMWQGCCVYPSKVQTSAGGLLELNSFCCSLVRQCCWHADPAYRLRMCLKYIGVFPVFMSGVCRLALQAEQQAQRGVDHGSSKPVSTACHSTQPAAAAVWQLVAAAGQEVWWACCYCLS